MRKTTRRHLLQAAAAGGVTAVGLGAAKLGATGENAMRGEHAGHQAGGDQERRTNHTVSFGNWSPSPESPIDRMTGDPNPRTRNGHFLIPSPVQVHEGDTVSFVISGFHNLLVYGPGTEPTDIDRTKLLLVAGFPPLIDDPQNRVYRGNDPRAMPAVQDRVEVVAFHERGRYLVMCGVLPHFFDAATGSFVMFGYVDVQP
jgi:hypothetical protein